MTHELEVTLSGIKRVCKALDKDFCAVTALSLGSSPLTDECVDCISKVVSRKLTELAMYWNMITDTGVTILCQELTKRAAKVTTLA